MTRGPRAAIKWAREHMRWEPGYCLQWVRSTFDVGSLYYDANEGWEKARYKHRVNTGNAVPKGVPVWWSNSSHGHVALSVGDGWCLSTDAGGSGVVAKVRIDDLTRRWNLNLRGWTADINGVRVFTPDPVPADGWDRVRLSAVGPGKPQSKDQRVVEVRLLKRFPNRGLTVDGVWGPKTTLAYAHWQERLGLPPRSCDGRPGKFSLSKLQLRVVEK